MSGGAPVAPRERRRGVALLVSGLGRLFGRAASGPSGGGPDGAPSLAAVVDLARAAEEAGISQIVLPDHVSMGERTDRYPYGRFPLPPDEPWLEPMTTLAAMASATRRIRLATGVLIAPLRPAALLAKTAATLDVLSGGRLDLGVGSGWQEEELAAGGVPFRARGRVLEETLRACRLLWREAPASFEGEFVRFHRIHAWPRPVQPGGVPLWLGVAPRGPNLRRIVELADGWLPLTPDLESLRAELGTVRRALEEAGRDPASLRVRAGAPVVRRAGGGIDVDATLGRAGELAELGVDLVSFALGALVSRREEIPGLLERLGKLDRELRTAG